MGNSRPAIVSPAPDTQVVKSLALRIGAPLRRWTRRHVARLQILRQPGRNRNSWRPANLRGGLLMTIPIKMVGSEEGRPSEGDATQCGSCLKRQSEVNYGVVLSTRRGGVWFCSPVLAALTAVLDGSWGHH